MVVHDLQITDDGVDVGGCFRLLAQPERGVWSRTELLTPTNAVAYPEESERQFQRRLAFPLIGAGTGGISPERALDIMQDEARQIDYHGEVRFVRFRPAG